MSQPNVPPQFPQYYPPPKRRRWWIPVLIIMIVLFLFVLPFLVIMGIASSFMSEEPIEVKPNSVLYLSLGEQLNEFSDGSGFEAIFGDKPTSFNDVLRAVKAAKKDSKISGIYYKPSGTKMGFAMNMELLDALEDFKKSGKFIYSYMDMGSQTDYLRCLPSDKIFMPTEGMLPLNGFGINSFFFKGLLDKIGVEFVVKQFEDFKSFGEMYSRRNFSDSAKLELRTLLKQRHQLFTESVAKYRKLEPAMINAALNRGIYTADSLKALGFIDSLAHELDVKDMMKKLTNQGVKDDKKAKLRLVSVADYIKSDVKLSDIESIDKDNQIAVIYAMGSIVDAPDNSFNNEPQITKKLAAMIQKAREDKKIKAIILRVDSPGGSVLTSEIIFNEVMKTRGVKPIYSSMSDVAASGGYYISMACDTIVAHPATITGSIGVIVALPNFSGLLKKLDVTSDTLSTTEAAQDLSMNYPFSKKQMDKLDNLSRQVYFRFLDKVAIGRKKTFDEIRAVAKGRVWTGEDAKRIGLVDVLGGLQTTIDLAKKRIGVPVNQKVRIKEYPEKTDPVDALMKMFKLKTGGEESTSIQTAVKDYFISKNLSFNETLQALPPSLRSQLKYLISLLQISTKEPVMMAMPSVPDLE